MEFCSRKNILMRFWMWVNLCCWYFRLEYFVLVRLVVMLMSFIYCIVVV